MYFENIRTYGGNATVFRGKCFLLSEQKLPSFREKPGSSSPGARFSPSESSRFYLFISWLICF
ncbi:hypothetical protein DWW00_01025 [Bacteroides fragilis]|uniref:Uncharacterized protein n=1 Tax=Bacteroides fragilis TaxID=817 RepID=A0A412YEL7_BACFG|nr:hypothetical protein DWW08_07710 [Bacteroides fragilis]RGV92269.1 hypothetical protein DWW00_01025 [Bacteroides fragilis]